MRSWDRILNPICEVEFAGFRSDTLTLQRAGWQLSMEQQAEFNSIRLAMKHEAARLYAISAPVTHHMLYLADRVKVREPILFRIQQVAGDMQLHVPFHARPNFFAVDATPQYCSDEVRQIEDLIPFRPISADAPEIIVADHSVAELMTMILAKQDPKQREIREKARRAAWREAAPMGAGYDPARDIRAQIVTVCA